ncbi:putative spliceosome associated protein [Operophtera brumata]|uniref:Putative spliceosome associated protein n=1 Tax=Operophtera brumata TaxID=104452 RepID=A0A0L7LN44_OPEBR|nr:putative spliceosome associated protein [Operophtera brumata]
MSFVSKGLATAADAVLKVLARATLSLRYAAAPLRSLVKEQGDMYLPNAEIIVGKMPSIDVMAPGGPVMEVVEEPHAPPPPVIGIIYPPPEVRNIVDKTASFVARNGPEFEARIRQNELGNPKFNFLNTGDPYHAYYQHKVKEIREGKGLAPATAARQQELLKAAAPIEPPPPRDPPPDFEFIADPPSISALELDIVKLTAQFVARNGRQFLTDLMKKEERNHQFDFLRPQHSLFQYFTRLLEQYTKVLLPPKELVSKLTAEIRSGILEQAKSRAAWHSHQARRKAADEARVEKAMVETVDYPSGEPGDFPPPTTPLEVGARVLAQERGEDLGQGQDIDDMEMQQQQRPDNNQVQDMEEESSSSEDEAPSPVRVPSEASLPPRPDRVVVKKYDPKRARPPAPPQAEEWLVSPITGEKIPANKIGEEERRRDERVTWDGHTSSVEAATRAARAHITLEDQIQQIHKVKGLLPDEEKEKIGPKPVQAPPQQRGQPSRPPPPPAPSRMNPPSHPTPVLLQPLQQLPSLMVLPPMAPRPPLIPAVPPGFGYGVVPLAERRTDIFGVGDEETAIGKKIGEEERRRDERVTWDGHTSSVEAATRAARAHITLEDQIQQIHKGLFFKDTNTLAYYNVPPGALIQLQVKERGGRKK